MRFTDFFFFTSIVAIALLAEPISKTITATWTAVGDDGITNGPATTYDLRYSTSMDSLINNFESCAPISGLPIPGIPNSTDSVSFTQEFEIGTTYYFAIKTEDDSENLSNLSNIASYVVEDTFAPAAILDFSIAIQ